MSRKERNNKLMLELLRYAHKYGYEDITVFTNKHKYFPITDYMKENPNTCYHAKDCKIADGYIRTYTTEIISVPYEYISNYQREFDDRTVAIAFDGAMYEAINYGIGNAHALQDIQTIFNKHGYRYQPWEAFNGYAVEL